MNEYWKKWIADVKEYQLAVIKEEWAIKLNDHGKWVAERMNKPNPPLHPGCYHEWKLYDGFRERYEYCTKCDTKKESQDEIRDETLPKISL